MKRNKTLIAAVIFLLGFFGSSTFATLIDPNIVEWETVLKPGQTITCIAHYIPDIDEVGDSLIFSGAPEFTASDYSNHSQWETHISSDNKMVWLVGPQTTNTTTVNISLFDYDLGFQWDDEDPDVNPDYPVYIDTVFYNGPEGSAPVWDGAHKGDPADPTTFGGDNFSEVPYGDTSGYTCPQDPLPEPATVLLFGLSFLLSRRVKGRLRN